MLGRLFGRNKGERDEAVCAACGRTLLAGEWTEKVEDEDGTERLLCSLCGQARPGAAGERLKVGDGTAGAVPVGADVAEPAEVLPGPDGPPRAAGRGENDALWKAIKDRDAQIERLKEQLARSEAERQELLALLAQARGAGTGSAEAGPASGRAAIPMAPDGDGSVTAPAPEAAHAVLDDTGEMPAVATPEDGTSAAGAAETQGPEMATAPTGAPEEAASEAPAAGAAPAAEAAGDGVAAGETTAEIAVPPVEAEQATAALTVLQRGVDLLNVSPVPRKIAETNADLGIPSVHVGYEDDAVAVTFMWTMGWYRFTVAVDSGSIKLADRGYDDRADLQPNASVRADGTVQLAAARISPAAAQRQRAASAGSSAAETAADQQDAGPAVTPPAGGPEILSKSLLGQRTDDEQQSWEKTQARDFDWDR